MEPRPYRLFAINNLSIKNILALFVIIASSYIIGQQLDNIKSQQPITLSGFVFTNQVNSLYFTSTMNILPQENKAVSVSFGKTLFKKLSFWGEVANSYLTNVSWAELSNESKRFSQLASWIMLVKHTSVSRNAINVNLMYIWFFNSKPESPKGFLWT